MDNIKWQNGINKVDAVSNRVRNQIKNLFFDEMKKNGFEQIDVPFIDYADTFILNGEYHTMQNHYKTIANNGEVLSIVSDLTPALISTSQDMVEKTGRLCSSIETYKFLPEINKRRNEYQIGSIIYGISGVDAEAELLLATYDFVKKLGVLSPKIIIGNNNVFRGILNTVTNRNESLDRLKRIVVGQISDDVDYACLQSLSPLMNIEGKSDIINELAEKLSNKQSLDGLLNLFEICNVLEAYNMNNDYVIKLNYLGENRYDNGFTFAIIDDKQQLLAYGGRCDCIKGRDKVNCVYSNLDVDNLVEFAKEKNIFDYSSNTIILAIADSRQAIITARNIKSELCKENMIVKSLYAIKNNDVINVMQKYSENVVMYVDENGKITHS